MSDDSEDDLDLEVDKLSFESAESLLSESADPASIIERVIPKDILEKYEVVSYRSAAIIMAESFPSEFDELLEALRAFTITKDMIRTAGGNESDIPKIISERLRPQGWHETAITGDLLVRLLWKEQTGTKKDGKPTFQKRTREMRRQRFLDGHKIDYVKNRVAFDLEWNSKDQTFDRDLYAFDAFSRCGVIDVGVLVTRSAKLNPVFRSLGPALTKAGMEEKKKNGDARMTYEKYGASTTWMGKLIDRLNAGRNGGCPVLAFGITPACISDWE